MRPHSFILPPSSLRRRGYSFPEVMFAVVVLGIGFIMLAAVFPVALQQSKTTLDETRASAIARQAISFLQEIAVDPAISSTLRATAQGDATWTTWRNSCVFPATGDLLPTNPPSPHSGIVCPFTNEGILPGMGNSIAWNAVRNAQIVKDDPRYAWVAFYRRDGVWNRPLGDTAVSPPISPWSQQVQVFVLVTQVKSRSQYDNTDINQAVVAPGSEPTSFAPCNLFPRWVQAKFTFQGSNAGNEKPDIVKFIAATPAAAEAAYIVRSAANAPARIYRLGAQRIDLDTTGATWELLPGNDMASAAENTAGTDEWCLMLGRELKPDGTYEGPAQDVSIYSTFISVRQAQ